jgi:hypothetical protein
MAGGFALDGKASAGYHRWFKANIKWYVWIWGIIAAAYGLMFGYDIGISCIVVSLFQFDVIYYRGSSASKWEISKNKILRGALVLCYLVPLRINKHEFRLFFAKLRRKIFKLDSWLHTNPKKNAQYIKMTVRKFCIRITSEFSVLATDVETIASTTNQTPPGQQESLVVSVAKSIPTNIVFPLCELHGILK